MLLNLPRRASLSSLSKTHQELDRSTGGSYHKIVANGEKALRYAFEKERSGRDVPVKILPQIDFKEGIDPFQYLLFDRSYVEFFPLFKAFVFDGFSPIAINVSEKGRCRVLRN